VRRVFQTKEETHHFYNKIARVYDLLAEHSEQSMREMGLKMLAAEPGETVLEVGFGTGHCLVELAQAVGLHGKVLGIDLSENMLAESRKLHSSVGERAFETAAKTRSSVEQNRLQHHG
jgi:demethylmenaquinone methyltransferase/2-methoxy-6-polyprenyl-1,4-benzoquinol methylase